MYRLLHRWRSSPVSRWEAYVRGKWSISAHIYPSLHARTSSQRKFKIETDRQRRSEKTVLNWKLGEGRGGADHSCWRHGQLVNQNEAPTSYIVTSWYETATHLSLAVRLLELADDSMRYYQTHKIAGRQPSIIYEWRYISRLWGSGGTVEINAAWPPHHACQLRIHATEDMNELMRLQYRNKDGTRSSV